MRIHCTGHMCIQGGRSESTQLRHVIYTDLLQQTIIILELGNL